MMVDNNVTNDIDLETFLRSAGQSFTDAQKALTAGLDVSVNMMLNNAELELKVAISSDAQGKMAIRPISSADIVRGGIDPGLLSTIRINFVSSVGEAAPQSASNTGGTEKGSAVPALVDRTLEEAVRLLKAAGWQFEPHAANSEEVAAAGKESRGRILRQVPQAGQTADKTGTVIHIWADLGTTPTREIDGIGIKTGEGLSKIGVNTIGELSLASSDQVASALRINQTRAQSYIDMAGLMSRLAILGFKDEVVELLVKGAKISSLEQLAGADPKELFRVCQDAVSSGKVQVPRGFGFTLDNVKTWIKTAGDYLGK
jgi:hypothetical protein